MGLGSQVGVSVTVAILSTYITSTVVGLAIHTTLPLVAFLQLYSLSATVAAEVVLDWVAVYGAM